MSDFTSFVSLSGFARWPEKMLHPDSQRLFHGRGQCYPSFEYFTVDYFSPVLWVVLYRQPEPQFWQQFTGALIANIAPHCETILIQNRYEKPAVTNCIYGVNENKYIAKEGAARYQLSFEDKQNIGYFMDMQPAREWLASRVEGRRVLNLFSYTCAFSVAAKLAGASEVVNVDMSKAAIQIGRDNHQLNNIDGRGRDVQFLAYDIFRSWGRIRKLGPYDVVICDPPSRQAGSFDARKDYPRLLRRLVELMNPGADLLACLNAPYLSAEFLRQSVEEQCPNAKFVERIAGRVDFPERDEDAALKVLHYRL
ncbi:MAG: class I SAM-dependent methyltransferase [Spongiibacteraceae bacterium]